MKKFLLGLALTAVALPDCMAYDIKMDGFCYDVVGYDSSGRSLLELVKGDTEFDSTQTCYIRLAGPDYVVVSVGTEALAGFESRMIVFDGRNLPAEKFTFKENCLRGAKTDVFPRINITGQTDSFEVVFESGSFADITTNYSGSLVIQAASAFMEGCFSGTDLQELRLQGKSDLYGGAFGDGLTTVYASGPIRTVCSEGCKVFPGLTKLDISGISSSSEAFSVNRLTDLTDFNTHQVEISIDNIYEVPYAGEDGGYSFASTVKIPGFMYNAYSQNPVWSSFNLEGVGDYLTDESGKYILKTMDNYNYAEVVGYNGVPESELVIPAVFTVDGAEYQNSGVYAGPFTGRTEIKSLDLQLNGRVWSRAFAGCTGIRTVKIAACGLSAGAFEGCPVTELDVELGVDAYSANGVPAVIFDGTVSRLTLGLDCSYMGLSDALAPGAVIESYAATPPRLAEQNPEVYSTAKVIVPYGTFAAYKNAEVWKNFADISERAYDGTTFADGPFMIKVLDKEARKCAISRLISMPQGAVLTIPATVTAPDGTEFIPCGLFGNLLQGTSFTEVDIQAPLDTIGVGAFSQMPYLRKIELPNTVTELYSRAFADCPNLREVRLSDNIKVLGYGLFMNCTALENIDIPAGVTQIETQVFSGCSRLSAVTIPAAVEKIGSECFSGTNLSALEFAPSATPLKVMVSLFYGRDNSNIDCLRIGRDVTVYLSNNFDENSITWDPVVYYSDHLVNRVELGSMVTDFTWFRTDAIADNAALVSTAEVPPVLLEYSQAQYDAMTVNVPESALEAYRAADVWKEFRNVIGDSGVDEVAGAPADAPVYDLNGRRVAERLEDAALVPGIYIQAGRKIVIR